MRDTRRSMDKLRSILALLLAFAMMAPAAFAEEGSIASDLAGDFFAGIIEGEVGEFPTEPVEVDIFAADLLVGYVAQPGATVNPFMCMEQDLVSLNQLVYESVVTLDDSQKPSPMLADSWSLDGKTWTFNLRRNITFHNGAGLTAYDVVQTYEMFVNMGNKNPYYGRINTFISDMAAVDDYTLQVQAKYSGYMTLYAMTFPVVHASTAMDDMPRGTGPYWYVSYEVDNAIRIEANPLWWKQQPALKSITFRRYEDVGSALEGLQTNEVDMFSTDSSSAALNRKLANLTSMDYGTTTYEMLVPNLSTGSEMSDLNLRKSVMYAIDRSVLASNAYLDMAIQSEVPVLPGTWLYESQSALYYYSPERALQYLYDSGWRDLTGDTMMNKLDGIRVLDLEINIITYNESTSSIRENAANTIAGYLNAVGIKTKVEVLTRNRVLSRIKDKDYDLALVGVNLSEVPVLTPLLSQGGSLNLNKYNNEEMNGMVARTGIVAGETELKQLYSQIQLTLVDRLPIMGLLFRTGAVLSTRSLGGMSGVRMLNMFRGLEYLSE